MIDEQIKPCLPISLPKFHPILRSKLKYPSPLTYGLGLG